jgi:hypothetical protein
MTMDGKALISPLARFDTAIDVARSVKGELFFTVKIHDSSPEEAARWVAEAKKRGMGGSYWCFGNEPYFKGNKFYVTKETYVDLVNRFSPAMKAADPDIRLGIGWCGPFVEEETEKGRESFILRNTKQWVDFIDYHYYTGRWDKAKGIDAKRIMAGSLMIAQNTRKFREIIQREAPEMQTRSRSSSGSGMARRGRPSAACKRWPPPFSRPTPSARWHAAVSVLPWSTTCKSATAG